MDFLLVHTPVAEPSPAPPSITYSEFFFKAVMSQGKVQQALIRTIPSLTPNALLPKRSRCVMGLARGRGRGAWAFRPSLVGAKGLSYSRSPSDHFDRAKLEADDSSSYHVNEVKNHIHACDFLDHPDDILFN
jgi:hypothetical protein